MRSGGIFKVSRITAATAELSAIQMSDALRRQRSSRAFQGFRKALCCQLATGTPIRSPITCPISVARVSEVQMASGAKSAICLAAQR